VTLPGYIKQAIALHTNRGLPNPHQVDINYIKVMTNAIKKYETVPKCKEMISVSMFHYIANLALRASEDLLVCTVTNWIALGCYTGFSKSEWCSNNHDLYAIIDNPNWSDRPNALPIIAEDFSFASVTGRHIHNVHSHPTTISPSRLCESKEQGQWSDTHLPVSLRLALDVHHAIQP
jgi:hypothetical protein